MEDASAQNISAILLIEPDAKKRAELCDIIPPSYEVICKNEQEEASAFLDDNSKAISLAIIDISIAFPLVQKIKENFVLETLPVLIVTDVDNSKEEEELIELDILDFIKAPFNKKRILNRLKTALKLSEVNFIIKELEQDELTGLLTRQAFLRQAENVRSQRPERKYCIIAFDFDNFKLTNSIYGEHKCNEFLAFTAHHLMQSKPKGICGRYGGDQYVLMFDYTSSVDVELLKSLRNEVLREAPIPHQIVKVGIYAPLDPELQILNCCDRAFLAINKIKGIYGKDIAFYENEVQQQLLNEQRISETMERGLEEGQFKIFYQPKHETITGNISGAEALVRWEHPEFGFMMPSTFIPLFEKNGFITKLDTFILEQVCKDIRHWVDNGFPLVPISVNISRHDFYESGIIEKQYDIIDSYKIDHSLLHMEVTESLYCENTELIISHVRHSQELGFMIEMDDFGSGYSSLGLLSTFPINILKLDISFVRNIIENEIVVENIIKMAHRMGFLTVAEGVETPEQFKMLKSLGCDFIQGFYFSKPLSVRDFENYIKKATVADLGKIMLSNGTRKEAIQLSENMLIAANEVAEGLPGGFFSYHADGNYEIISFNTAFMKMMGCSSGEEFRNYTGNSFRGILNEPDFDVIQESINTQITQNNDIYFLELILKSKTGSSHYVKALGRYMKTKKYGDIYYVFINDITDEQRHKAAIDKDSITKIELERTVQLSISANNAKDIFVQNIAQDLMPPMQNLIDCTNLILQDISNPKKIEENVAKLKKAEELLLGYVYNLEEFSRVQTKSITLDEIASDMTDAAKRIYTLIENLAKEKGINLKYWSEIESPYIYQDINHTTNVVLNILQNAIKYTPKGGTVTFGLRQKLKDKDTCTVEFICEDTGIGISNEFMPYIFNNFVREDNEINQKIPSSGIGLYLAKSLLDFMNGSIEITSEKGKGTVVHTIQTHRLADKKDVLNNTTLVDNINHEEK